jgi:hypothetical protein
MSLTVGDQRAVVSHLFDRLGFHAAAGHNVTLTRYRADHEARILTLRVLTTKVE